MTALIPADEELTRRAQAGETAALGLLLDRHRAPMRAVALSLLGHGPDAEDAVQDAALIALRRIGDVRDPAAVGAWLRAIVRNRSRMHLRAEREAPGLDSLDRLRPGGVGPAHPPCPSVASHPEQVVDRHAMRDWIWDAVEQLPEPMRLVLMLRHFSGVTSYQEIARACDIPVGTVRSRLSQARSTLAQVLLATATQAHDDFSRLAEDSRREAEVTLEGARCGRQSREILELWPAETELLGVLSTPGERSHPFPAMRRNREKGVTQRLRHVTASRTVTIWEMDVINPVGVPDPCPPSLVWLMVRRNRRVQSLRVLFPASQR
ncbi:sigma-70 family RNA polymerase sigma factor [Streptomyces sp. NPDC004539]|uniref:RNA polymerase sigma factor n=1 Tax=Streptomyces sp. NPDC004539 TaxID=3154280 RepID=UPI0033B08509